jgi:C4-dicarboxylate-specific signal transduction histidine kinase
MLYFILEWMPPQWAYAEVLSPLTRDCVKVLIDCTVFLVTFGTVFYFFHINEMNEAQLRRSMADFRAAQAVLVQSGKMAALGEMAGGMAHEINTPLATIRVTTDLMAEILKDETLDRAQLATMAARISTTTQRIARIVSGLRGFSRNEAKEPLRPVGVSEILSETLLLCTERLRNMGIELKTPPSTDLRVSCRPTQISQVILNLLNNACDAVGSLGERWVSIDMAAAGADTVLISITDSGPGIPDAVVEKMFQPFFTTKEVGKGTGLGLSLSRQIVEDHGGSLRIDPQCANTRFEIRLPRA